MPAWTMVNGVWREMWANYSRVNGVWRDNNNSVMINGVIREVHSHDIAESDIIGFRMIYKLSYTKKHPDLPQLSFNPNLPVRAALTGETLGFMDTNTKGIVFEYKRDNPDDEGIYMYEGTLYAILTNDEIINVCGTRDDVGDERVDGVIPGINEAWCTNRIANLPIQIDATLLYESYGYHMAGWNSFFSTEEFIDPTKYPDKGPNKNFCYLNSYNILPIESRSDTFSSISSIGIARDMETPVDNMVGSYGLLDQSISAIRVNGVPKPFVIELYN